MGDTDEFVTELLWGGNGLIRFPVECFDAPPALVMANVFITAASRLWGTPETWTMPPSEVQNLCHRFARTGWRPCIATDNPMLSISRPSDVAPGYNLWQDEDVPPGIDIKRIHGVPGTDVLLWCIPT